MDIYGRTTLAIKPSRNLRFKTARGFDMTTTIANFIGAFVREYPVRGSAYPVSLKDINDHNTDEIIVDYITIPFKTALKLIDTDTNSNIFRTETPSWTKAAWS
jgi:hypothetical protein